MDLFLKRLQNLPAYLTRRQYKRWLCQQSKDIYSSVKLYEKTFHSFSSTTSYRMRMGNNLIWQFDKQGPGFSQAPPKIYNSINARSELRNWEAVETKSTPRIKDQEGIPFRIVSYNILAQNLLVGHLHLYRFCNQSHLKWSYRLARLSEEILAQKPDIVCMQEVQENHLSEIVKNITNELPLNYVFKKKTGFRDDGCAIFYNKNLFEAIAIELVEYFQPGIDLLDRHNIGLIVKLRCKANPSVSFLVCTTHLLYNPNRQDIRLAQIMVLLAELDRHSVSGGHDQRIPVVITGDFNFKPDSALFEFITTGELCYEKLVKKTLTEADNGTIQPIGKNFISYKLGITDTCKHIDCVKSNYKDLSCRLHFTNKTLGDCERKPIIELDNELFSTGRLSHAMHLKSMYDHCGTEPYGSTYQNEWITVDYMFFSEPEQTHSKQGFLQLLSVYQLPTKEKCRQIGALPNAYLGSDHLMLASDLYLYFPKQKA